MKKIFILLAVSILSNLLLAQPWTYDFGTGTGTANNTNAGSGNTAIFTGTPSGGGTYRTRIGTGGGSLGLVNPGTSLGTGTEAQLTAATSTSTNKLGIYDWTSPSTVAYMKAKIRNTSSGNGNLNVSLGINTAANDNQGYTSHYNNSLASFTIAYTAGSISSVVRRISGSNTAISTHGFVKDADQTIEVYANNSSSTVSYYKSGVQTLAAQTWDLWVDGVKVVDDAAKAGTLAAATNLSGFAFFAESSTGNAANIYLDDFEYSNSLRQIVTTGTLSALSTTYGTASSNTSFDIVGVSLASDITVTAPAGFEVSTSAGSGFGPAVTLTPTSGTVGSTTIYVRLAAATNAGTYSGNVSCTATGATTINVATVSSTVSQASQTITFGALADANEFDPDFNLTGTASSGLTVSYSSSNPSVATVSGNTVTIVGAGTTTITASQAGNTNYAAAVNVDQTLTVNAASGTPQTITFGALSNVTYGDADFNLTATASSGLTVSYVSSDPSVATVSGNTVTIVGAGTTTITASQAGDGTFQPAADKDQSLTVDPKNLTVSGAAATDKTYNRNTSAAITGASLVGIVGSDNVTVSGGGTFADPNVANGISVTANLSLGGTHAANYTLTQPTGLTANITAQDLTVTGISISDKQYDAANTATISGTASLGGVVSGDESDVIVGGSPSAIFTSVNVNTGISVTVSGYSISGSASGNYTLNQPTGLTANITLKPLTVNGLTADNKTYDATTAATLSGTGSLSGIISGEESNVNLDGTPSGTFIDPNIGTGKNVTVSGYSISGTASSNYSLNTLILPADISQKTITVSGATASDKAYDGTTTASVSGGTLSGVETADNGNVSVSASGTFAQSSVGDNIAVTLALTGSASANYFLTQPGITASITAAACVTQSVNWDFATASPSSSAIPNLAVSALSQGNNNGTTTMLGSATASNVYGGASGGNNAGAAAFTGSLNTATSTYFEFTLTPDNGYEVLLSGISFGTRSTTTGAQAFTLRSSKDAYSSDIATGTIANNSTWSLKTALASFTGSEGTAVTFRLFGHNGTGSPSAGTANWKIDDLSLTVKLVPVLSSAATASICDGSTFTYTPGSDAVGASFKWTRAAVAGISNAAVTAPQTADPSEILDNTSGTAKNVIYAYQIIANNCFSGQDVTVTVNAVQADAPSNVTACDSYTLPALTVGNYFDGPGGTGTAYSAGNVISSSMTMYVYAETGTTPNCSDENSFAITINTTPVADDPADVTACDSYTLPALTVGNYFDGPGGTGTAYSAGNVISSSTTLYVYAETGTTPNCSDENSFAITINTTPVADAPSNVTACDSYTLPALTVGNYFDGPGGTGTAYSAGNVISSSTTLYVYAETGTTPNCSDENNFAITINTTPVADDPADVTACDSYTLPALTIGNYFDGPGGTGTAYSAGNVISSSMTLYVYAETGTTPNCSDENSFAVTINTTPVADDPADVTACDSYTLPALSVGNYFDGPGGTGTAYSPGNVISSSITMYVYAETGTTPNCSDENSFAITINTTPVADAPSNVTACDSYTLPALTVGNYFDGPGGTGTAYSAGNVISSSTTMYVYAETGTTPNCSDENSFAITINTTPSVTSTTDGGRCAAGTVDIEATASAGTIEWYTASSGGSSIGSGSPFTTPSISVTKTYYAQAVDNGCSSPRMAVAAQVVPNTKLITAACGSTLTAFNDKIYANNITGATDYRFEVTDGTTTIEIDRVARYFYITQFTGYDYATTYTVRVKAKVNGFWGCYSADCQVTTPARPTTQISAAHCGTTLPTIDTRIFAYSMSTAAAYRFRVTQGVSVQTIDKTENVFRLTDLGTYNYGTAYTIDVAYEVNGVFGSYGTSCVVTTPTTQAATQIQASQCGGTLTASNDKIMATSIHLATEYRFEVTYGGNTQVIDRTARYFYITQYTGWAHNRTYSVRVATKVNGSWGTYGSACNVTTPASGMKQDQTIHEASEDLLTDISVEAYPNPNSGDFTINSRHEGTFNIVNELGQLIQQVEISAANGFQARAENLPKGIYFIVGTINSEVITRKIIVQ
ncbi:MAG: YDG domain-containing protein [Bacteroidota bacterium]